MVKDVRDPSKVGYHVNNTYSDDRTYFFPFARYSLHARYNKYKGSRFFICASAMDFRFSMDL